MRLSPQSKKDIADIVLSAHGFLEPIRLGIEGSAQFERPGVSDLNASLIDNAQVHENRPEFILKREEPVLKERILT
jgi:hypothetical protein